MADPVPSWRPSVQDVADLIRARTKIRGDIEVGTFQDEDQEADPPVAGTRPNATQVERYITRGCRRVIAAIGGAELCDEAQEDGLEDDAANCAALYAAMIAEQSLDPESTNDRNSSFSSLKSLFNEELSTLTEAVDERCGGASGGGAGGTSGALAKAGASDGLRLIGRTFPEW